ncbi:MAG: ketose-bisphosphate aldolase [Actinomycetes bacterium]
MLITGKQLLDVANKHNFAIPAFNISDYAMLNGIIEISEEMKAPLIIAIHPDELKHIGSDVMFSIIAKSHKASVPVTIHYDHGTTFAHMMESVQTGFTSAMIDGSLLPFEENVAITRKTVDALRLVNVSVEGELGTIGANDSYGEAGAAEIIYTTPKDARIFVEETAVDSLAIAIGTSHGLYPVDVKPKLRIDLLKEIKADLGIPLVLHGGSSNADSEIAEAVKYGINKINISSDIKVAYQDKMREVLSNPKLREPNVIQPACIAAMKVVARAKIELFNASGKASLY